MFAEMINWNELDRVPEYGTDCDGCVFERLTDCDDWLTERCLCNEGSFIFIKKEQP